MESEAGIILQPRPYAQQSGKLLLLPLLPQCKPLKLLPVEVWSQVFALAVVSDDHRSTTSAFAFLTICKSLKDIVLPILFSKVEFSNIWVLDKFYRQLHSSDQKWDSIRRIPYSTPGRWVQELSLSQLTLEGPRQALLLDSILTRLFSLTPLLQYLSINPSFVSSRRLLDSLAQREGSLNLRVLRGFRYFRSLPTIPGEEDPFVRLLRCCPNLEQFEIIGQELDPIELDSIFQESVSEANSYSRSPASFIPLRLPSLRNLSILSMHSSPLMYALLRSPLPALQKLIITPYDDIPHPISLISEFISTHGLTLRSLLLLTPKSWPTRLHPSPKNVLQSTPILRHLSLEKPLPCLWLIDKHPLEILSIPRPNQEFWPVLEKLLPLLPRLQVVHTRDVKWLKKGISSVAQEAGVQGEMKKWRGRLLSRGIRVLDADWSEFA